MRAGSLGGLRTGISVDDSGLFALPEQEPENPISLKSPLEFIPKTFDGNNVPVSRFVRDCIYARNLIGAKNRQNLFLIIRSRVSGSAFNALLDRGIYTLEELLKALKDKYTAHRNLSQLNSTLETVSEKQNETVADYGDRVGEILKIIIEVIEERNIIDAAVHMIRSARDTACENFVMGLKPGLVLRVKLDRPRILQDAIMAARSAEWEVDFTESLSKEKKEKFENNICNKGYQDNRFRPYRGSARAYTRRGVHGPGSGIDLYANEITRGKRNFLVDTGAELSIIHNKKLKLDVKINSKFKFIFCGIGGKSVTTLGEVFFNINGSSCSFHVVPDEPSSSRWNYWDAFS